eukprot:6214563-Pleurochrysis_carterae.AAC.7
MPGACACVCKAHGHACARRNACRSCANANAARMLMRRACISVRVRRARTWKCTAHGAWRILRQPSTHFCIGKRINACDIRGCQRLMNQNQCHALRYRRLAYQSSPSRQAQEILVCDLQSRHDYNISKERATKSKYNKTLRTECKKPRCAKASGGVNVVPDSASSRRWGIVSTAVCTRRSR